MKTPLRTLAQAACLALALSASAQAEIQTWRLTATVYQTQGGFSPPAFAQVGNTFSVDYVIDADAPADTQWGSMFPNVVKSFTINGTASAADGYILDGWGLNASPDSPRSDGIDFLSFYHFGDFGSGDTRNTLTGFGRASQEGWATLRVDFGPQSVWARSSSFALTPVPEPSAIWLLAMGAFVVCWGARRRG